MATTTNFGWETPDDTDLVKDGALAMRTLGNAIDASFVDLKGGTTNQVLAKNSNTDLDFKWVADASGIPATIFDAKGDLIAATAADTADRLAVGTNGQVLTADSSTATGLKWATPASSTTNFYVPTGRSFYVKQSIASVTTVTATEDVTYFSPVYLPACTLDRIGANSANTFSGSSTVRLGIYNNGTNNLPTTVLLDAGTLNFTNPGDNLEITISQTISAGIYWLAFNSQTAASTNAYLGANGSTTVYSEIIGYAATAANGNANIGYRETGITGAFATVGTLTNTANNIPDVYVRIS
jgi:hypothetical protein